MKEDRDVWNLENEENDMECEDDRKGSHVYTGLLIGMITGTVIGKALGHAITGMLIGIWLGMNIGICISKK